jgi:hypothetical protein
MEASTSVPDLLLIIKAEADQWVQAGAINLRSLVSRVDHQVLNVIYRFICRSGPDSCNFKLFFSLMQLYTMLFVFKKKKVF